jgi:hypothetical protein
LKHINNGYTTVWEVSPFSNGALLFALVWVVVVALLFITKRPDRKSNIVQKTMYFLVLPFGALLGMVFLLAALKDGRELPAALRQGRCEVVAGNVTLVHEQAYGGHGNGDIIRIGQKQFEIDYFTSGFGYKQTVSHGGWLTNGVSARLHYIGNMILKVEIGQ